MIYGPCDNLKIVRTRKPTLDLARIAQPIGMAAWAERLPNRSSSQIKLVFNAETHAPNAYRLLDRMQSKVGKFVGVVALKDTEPIGYAWAADDVGNISPTMQGAKIAVGKLRGVKPYAWNAHINVAPIYQGIGIGGILLNEVLAPFDNDQRPSAYVFDENPKTLDWFKRRGYYPRPNEPSDPNDTPYGPDLYFGPGEHVSRWRLEAPRVDVVRQEIASRISDLLDYEDPNHETTLIW